MRKFTCLLVITLLLLGCQQHGESSWKEHETNIQQANTSKDGTPKKETKEMNMKLLIRGKGFNVELEDQDSAHQLIDRLPIQLTLHDLHQNEKYVYLDESLPSSPKAVGYIQAGDVMLFGSDCLVIFYESFSTSYTYTRIGTITDITGLKEILGIGSVVISFQDMKEE